MLSFRKLSLLRLSIDTEDKTNSQFSLTSTDKPCSTEHDVFLCCKKQVIGCSEQKRQKYKILEISCLVADVGTMQLPSALWVLPGKGPESLALQIQASVKTGVHL